MPEAFAVVLVATITVALFVAAWLQARHTRDQDPAQRREQLEQHLRWLEDRRRHAEEHHWGDDMKQKLEADLAWTRTALAKIPSPPPL